MSQSHRRKFISVGSILKMRPNSVVRWSSGWDVELATRGRRFTSRS